MWRGGCESRGAWLTSAGEGWRPTCHAAVARISRRMPRRAGAESSVNRAEPRHMDEDLSDQGRGRVESVATMCWCRPPASRVGPIAAGLANTIERDRAAARARAFFVTCRGGAPRISVATGFLHRIR